MSSKYTIAVDWGASPSYSVTRVGRRDEDGRILLLCGRAVEKSTTLARSRLLPPAPALQDEFLAELQRRRK